MSAATANATTKTSNVVVYGVKGISCPCCGGKWLPNDWIFSEMARELESWDRRYDSSKTIVSHVLMVLVDDPSELLPIPSDIS